MRSTIAEINLFNLRHNLKMIRKAAGNSDIMPVIKADAYGHGAVRIAQELRKEGVDVIGVAFADEAVRLRREGDTGEIFILIPGTELDIDFYAAYNLQASVEDFEVLRKLSEEAVKRNMKIKTHLFINSGMNRDGIKPENAIEFMNESSRLAGIEMIGILTHLASSELDDRTFANYQLNQFDDTIEKLKAAGYNFKYIHSLNSGGVLNFSDPKYNIARCGISLYGYMDFENMSQKLDLKPVMTLKSKVININTVSEGDNVGYSLKYISDSQKKVAVVPFGYGDGYHRILSGKADCLIHGRRYKLVGTICMDQCLIDVGNDDVTIGDEVVFLGVQGNDTITAYELAEVMGTIPYEITTAIKERVPRIYID
ncbi:MAG: alanine racemase [Candidatus Kapabacteria bacterium]|nr:alanine racemase [Ignavibacteriota bacterium]MCW5883640.1 alanine racemase [Candidatus Kapabacteria bacterium]